MMRTIEIHLTEGQYEALLDYTDAWNEYIRAAGGSGSISAENALELFALPSILAAAAANRRREMAHLV